MSPRLGQHFDDSAGANEVGATFELAPGVYVYRLNAGGEAAARKMVVRR